MGDITDWLLGSEDAFPDPFSHDDEEPYYTYYRVVPRCKYCGSTQVTWAKLEGKWRLYTKGLPHKCNEYFNK